MSEHFVSTEFDCHCKRKGCTITYIDSDLIDLLEQLRDKWGGNPILIKSGFRCVDHNAKAGGKSGSRHLVGKAADFDMHKLKEIVGIDVLIQDCQAFGGLGLSIRKSFIHGDVRKTRARWKYKGG